MSEGPKHYSPEGTAAASETDSLPAEFPSEPFACPACGQMLAPSCRVCVVCKLPINPAEIKKLEPAVAPMFQPQRPTAQPSRARFSWSIFLVVLLSWLLLAGLTERFLGPAKSQLLLISVVILSSAWVLYDAHDRLVPKPLRWGFGSLLLWIVVFPWYLARRRDPLTPCRLVEAEAGPLTRLLLAALVIAVLLATVLMALKRLGIAP